MRDLGLEIEEFGAEHPATCLPHQPPSLSSIIPLEKESVWGQPPAFDAPRHPVSKTVTSLWESISQLRLRVFTPHALSSFVGFVGAAVYFSRDLQRDLHLRTSAAVPRL
jgi:hypothetical protein